LTANEAKSTALGLYENVTNYTQITGRRLGYVSPFHAAVFIAITSFNSHRYTQMYNTQNI